MGPLESLPPDQRAVLQLVLQRGQSYDDIAKLLSIDRAAVRERALAAFDALGPQSRVPAERRALITDYLLGQLPPQIADSTRARLAQSPAERAWARVLAAEVSAVAAAPLPEIPVDAAAIPHEEQPAIAPEEARPAAAPPREPRRPAASRRPARAGAPAGAREASGAARGYGLAEPERVRHRPSSRRGGAALLIAGALIAVVVLVVVLVSGGSSGKHNRTASTPASTSSAASTQTTSTNAARPIAQIKLVPANPASKAAGVAIVLKRGTTTGILIYAQNVPANSKHDAYAVWLYNSQGDSHILGFVNPGVTSNGRLQTAGGLPANAANFKQLLVTLETQANPHAPGKIVLEGQLTGLT